MKNKMKNIGELDLSSLSIEELLELENKIKELKKTLVPKGYRVSFVFEYKEANVPEYPYSTHPLENQRSFYDFIERGLEKVLEDIDYESDVFWSPVIALRVEELNAKELQSIINDNF
jgi:hypothetical protein